MQCDYCDEIKINYYKYENMIICEECINEFEKIGELYDNED